MLKQTRNHVEKKSFFGRILKELLIPISTRNHFSKDSSRNPNHPLILNKIALISLIPSVANKMLYRCNRWINTCVNDRWYVDWKLPNSVFPRWYVTCNYVDRRIVVVNWIIEPLNNFPRFYPFTDFDRLQAQRSVSNSVHLFNISIRFS